MDAGRDRGIRHLDVLPHIRRVEDGIDVRQRARERPRIVDIDLDHAFRSAQSLKQRARRIDADVADRDLVIGALDEVGDSCRTHLAGAPEDEDARHRRAQVVMTSVARSAATRRPSESERGSP